MPAIQPAKLKAQVLLLAEQFSQPQKFERELTELLDQYADHTHKPGHSGAPPPLLTTFNTPLPVLRQLWSVISPLVTEMPLAALDLSDLLWLQPYLEHRYLAADILGQLPIDLKEEVIVRVQTWINHDLETRLVDVLLHRGLKRLRNEVPQIIIELADQWLQATDQLYNKLGLGLLFVITSDAAFDNLPAIFRLITPFLRNAPPPLRPDILLLLKTLIHRSPAETAFHLNLSLRATNNPDSAWLLRQVMAEFPADQQSELRRMARLSKQALK